MGAPARWVDRCGREFGGRIVGTEARSRCVRRKRSGRRPDGWAEPRVGKELPERSLSYCEPRSMSRARKERERAESVRRRPHSTVGELPSSIPVRADYVAAEGLTSLERDRGVHRLPPRLRARRRCGRPEFASRFCGARGRTFLARGRTPGTSPSRRMRSTAQQRYALKIALTTICASINEFPQSVPRRSRWGEPVCWNTHRAA